jgi:hypothetical protein
MNFFHEERLGKLLIGATILLLSGHVVWALVRYLVDCQCQE